jgi:hypothetical protein
MLVMLMMACNPETNVKAGVPELVLDIDIVDFGEVILGRQATVELAIFNDGIGDLSIDSVELDSLSSPEFSLVGDTPIVVERGEYGGPSIRYVPSGVGQDLGRVVITSNDPDQPELELALSAFGVEPLVDVDPGTLWYGIVPSGESRTLSVSVAARGTGTLNIQQMNLSFQADEVFSIALPAGVELPYKMATGLSFDFSVTYAAKDNETWQETLTLVTNDPTTPSFEISLLANTPDDPTKNAPPVVEITDPNYGEYYLVGQAMPVAASVYDEEDAAEDLYCDVLTDGSPTGTSGSPDAKGSLHLSESNLSEGDELLTVRCIDSGGEIGEDTVEIAVFDPKEPLRYTISGGPTLFDYWTIDDDVTVYVNSTTIFSDTNRGMDTHPPLEFDAVAGDTIRIVASDVNYCEHRLDPLTLHFGTNYSLDLNDEICESACSDDACYDSTLSWSEGVFYEESFTITIP